MKIAALDIGDSWTGVALSDALGITARPYQTVETVHLVQAIEELISLERIVTIVVGYPKTMKGTVSQQTIKTEEAVERLKKQFPHVTWLWWDERLTSKQAATLTRPKTKKTKLETHAVAAALLLMGYLASVNH